MCFKACKRVSSMIEHFLVGNILERYGKGVQELASLLNVSFVIELYTTSHFPLGFIGMDVRVVQG
jgi:hypothetical protein